jgi:hypothetical protein
MEEVAVRAPGLQDRFHRWRRYCLIEEPERGLIDVEFSRHKAALDRLSLGECRHRRETAVTSCADANGFRSKMLWGNAVRRPQTPRLTAVCLAFSPIGFVCLDNRSQVTNQQRFEAGAIGSWFY